MFAGHYEKWRESRVGVMKKLLGDDFFKGKSILEVGCGFGEIGFMLSQQGATVTCSDARIEHIEEVRRRHSELSTRVDDLDTNLIDLPYFDVIVHLGVLYHLKNFESNLMDTLKHCNYLILETEVCDSTDSTDVLRINETGYDQAFNGVGSRPSPSYIERILESQNTVYRTILDGDLNHAFHRYDWVHTNSKRWENGLRRFWICWKKEIPSPILA